MLFLFIKKKSKIRTFPSFFDIWFKILPLFCKVLNTYFILLQHSLSKMTKSAILHIVTQNIVAPCMQHKYIQNNFHEKVSTKFVQFNISKFLKI